MDEAKVIELFKRYKPLLEEMQKINKEFEVRELVSIAVDQSYFSVHTPEMEHDFLMYDSKATVEYRPKRTDEWRTVYAL